MQKLVQTAVGDNSDDAKQKEYFPDFHVEEEGMVRNIIQIVIFFPI